MMTDAVAFWCEIFGNEAPVEIEIGSGDGAFIAVTGARNPSRNYLGIERSPAKARRLAVRIATLGIGNVRTLRADARCLVTSIVPPDSVAAYHVYFPDPWPKRSHANRRIFSPAFVSGLARTLMAGGELFFATDVQGYAAVAQERILANPEFRQLTQIENHPGLATSFARKYRVAGRPLYAYTFVRTGVGSVDQLSAASMMRSM